MKPYILIFLFLILFSVSEQNFDPIRKNLKPSDTFSNVMLTLVRLAVEDKSMTNNPKDLKEAHLDQEKKVEESRKAEKKEEVFRRRIREVLKNEDQANKRLLELLGESKEALKKIKLFKSELEKSRSEVNLTRQKSTMYMGKAKKYKQAAEETKKDLLKLFNIVNDFTSQYNRKNINQIKIKYNFK